MVQKGQNNSVQFLLLLRFGSQRHQAGEIWCAVLLTLISDNNINLSWSTSIISPGIAFQSLVVWGKWLLCVYLVCDCSMLHVCEWDFTFTLSTGWWLWFAAGRYCVFGQSEICKSWKKCSSPTASSAFIKCFDLNGLVRGKKGATKRPVLNEYLILKVIRVK